MYHMYLVFSQKLQQLANSKEHTVTMNKLEISLRLNIVGIIWDNKDTQLKKNLKYG